MATSRLRIGVVAFKAGPGISDMLMRCAESMSSRASVEVWTNAKRVGVSGEVSWNRCNTHAGAAGMALDLLQGKARRIARQIEHNVETVYLFAPHLLNAEVAKHLSRTETQVVSHIHDPTPHSGQRYARAVLASQGRLVRYSDKVVVYGDAVARQLAESYGQGSNIISLPCPAPIDQYQEYPRRKRRLILFQGRIEEYKGFEEFVEAMTRLKLELRDFIPMVATPDRMSQAQLKACSSAGVAVRQGLLTDVQLAELMASSALGVLPYRDATQSAVLSNFFACGTPVVASNVGGISEVVVDGRTGFLCRPADPIDLAEAILKAISCGELARMGTSAFAEFRQNLSWPGFVDRFLAEVGSVE